MLFRGIDVSVHNGNVEWNKVSADFAILRAGYGREISQKDKMFETNYKGCKDNNIPCGAYWYSYATTVEDALREAKTCLEVIKGKSFEYPIYFDVEEASQFRLGKSKVSAIIDTFCRYLEKQGYFVGLYMSKYYLETYVTEDIRAKYAVWVAQYSDKCTYKGQYAMWQYSVAGNTKFDTANIKSVSGVRGECDCNYCYIDYPTVIKKAGLNGFTLSPTNNTGVVSNGSVSNAPVQNDSYTMYTVKRGDTLWGIAQSRLRNGSRYSEIKSLNGLKSDTIYEGQTLKIPKC